MAREAFGLLPSDAGADSAVLVGRVWDPETQGPRVVVVLGNCVHDITSSVGTVSDLLEVSNPVQAIAHAVGQPRWATAEILSASLEQDAERPHLLAPIDLQVVKACGVTFIESMVERVIEERCGGDVSRVSEVRSQIGSVLNGSLASLRPGSPEALRAKEVLTAQGMWSQYLEVGIGPYPEVFTKAPVLSCVGYGAAVGIPTFSSWNNPEPELVLLVNSRGDIRGATLGNDVNLRDIEGRSSLLLGMAKDNNASSAVGPFVRLFDDQFTLGSLRDEEISLTVNGLDGYVLQGENNVAHISRPFEELVAAVQGDHHQYPDGFCLFTGTLFAPTQDRGAPGQGFTHKRGDVVTIRSRHLGALVNITGVAEELPKWTYGIRELVAYLRSCEG